MTSTTSGRRPVRCGSLMGWEQARALAYRLPRPLPVVDLPLAAAVGDTLAAPLIAATMLPGYDNAAMDGYAVRGPGPWRLIGRCLAGRPGPAELADGQAAEIATGAVIPAGTRRVVPYEVAQRTGDTVEAQPAGPGHIRRAGEYVALGQQVLPEGRQLTAAAVGLAASVGIDTVSVRRRPTVRLLITGDEIITAGIPAPGQVRDAIAPVLTGLLRSWAADLLDVRWLPDHPRAVAAAAIEDSLADADVTVVCGSSSVGPADGLHDTITAIGAEQHVDGVDCRPGHPQVLAGLESRWLVGLPGNPYAAMVAAFTLLQPLLSALAGRRPPDLPRASLLGDVKLGHPSTRIVPVRWEGPSVRTVGAAYPGYLGGAADADALAVVPPGWCADQPAELLLIPR